MKPVPEKFRKLADLAYNLWFGWNDDAIRLFQSIHPDKWEQGNHNPVSLLSDTTPEDWNRLAGDKVFAALYESVVAKWESQLSAKTWFSTHYPDHRDEKIAYFSAEFGFHESLPIYSGGLGVLAGDHLKSASDLGLPLIGIGLLYKKGYFRQRLDSSGSQMAERVDSDFSRIPIKPVLIDGKEAIVTVDINQDSVKLKIWKVQIGRNPLYLLDSDVEGNSGRAREITSQLYGGGQDMRIAQEIALGIGGVKALRALGIAPSVYHINEGHAAFLSLERMREYVHSGVPFETALELIRASTVFTTHTPVPAGHDAFSMDLLDKYLDPLLSQLVYERERVIGLGFDQAKNLFNMTFLAMNSASMRNGVSKLHGHVSRMMFRAFHGNIEVDDVPIGHVTNGIHLESWTAPELLEQFNQVFPSDWQERQASPEVWDSLDRLTNSSLWETHHKLKEKLVQFARQNQREQRRRNGESAERIRETDTYLNADVLTIGFARRFATYKRANLLFKDLDRLNRIVNHPSRPVQFIFAGKAHPADIPGQDLIREIYRVSQLNKFRGKIILLENYDINLARYLVQGVDVWLNNPLRPLEASGTSGQKAAMNGVLNFSVLDGWWEEGYNGSNGWAIESDPNANWQEQEQQNAESLYGNLEDKIAPLYYSPGAFPEAWTEAMKRSIRTLAPEYNTHRMVQNYADTFYVPSMDRFQLFQKNRNAAAAALAGFKMMIRHQWNHVRVVNVTDELRDWALPDMKEVKVDVTFGDTIRPLDVAVEIVYYADNPQGVWEPIHVPLSEEKTIGAGLVRYHGQIPSHLVHIQHYSVRIRPTHPLFAHRFEVPQFFTTVPG
ncbi:alpha-glucan family phosphorylase [Gorillibacterium massiliense]|uniref:alpha-glucan family phosphorylase n=1 Tax=Gorillibacterium massiliense TaxID=1280390 RepID=UPI0004B84C5A|nr:alpha-glucan family phosphorylase [Gorillibacterium massiliense]